MAKSYIVTASGKDRPGIVADVLQVLYEKGTNMDTINASLARVGESLHVDIAFTD